MCLNPNEEKNKPHTKPQKEEEEKPTQNTTTSTSSLKLGKQSKKKEELKLFTRAEVLKHNSRGDAWLIIRDEVYDVTDFVTSHPGGQLLILDVAGRDVTDPFLANHPDSVVEKHLPMFKIGKVSDPVTPPEEVLRYRKLFQKFKDENWFETDMTYYHKKFLWFSFLFFSGVYFVFQDYPITAAIFIGMFFQQMAFWGHDLGHNSVSHERKTDMNTGLFHTLMWGVSVCWWKASHNVHHLTTNSVEYDPDIQHMPVFAVTTKLFDIYSLYHERLFPFKTDPIAQFFIARQHLLYLPIMALARFNLYLQSYIFFFKARTSNKYGKVNEYEIFSLIGFFTWFTLLTLQFPTLYGRLTFLFLSHAIAGILHVQITISHFGMPTISKKEESQTFDSCENFVKHQLDTSMDVDCPRWMDWFHGGLQFQGVHHMYPRLPRHRLRAARNLVKETFADGPNGVTYTEKPFFAAIGHTLGVLKCTAEMVGDFVNCVG